MNRKLMPIAMGALMGPMMLWMVHGMLSGNSVSGMALVVFVGAHVVVVGLALAAAYFAARLSPRLRARIDRLHRPSLRHMAAMLGSAALAALVVHLVIHGAA